MSLIKHKKSATEALVSTAELMGYLFFDFH